MGNPHTCSLYPQVQNLGLIYTVKVHTFFSYFNIFCMFLKDPFNKYGTWKIKIKHGLLMTLLLLVKIYCFAGDKLNPHLLTLPDNICRQTFYGKMKHLLTFRSVFTLKAKNAYSVCFSLGQWHRKKLIFLCSPNRSWLAIFDCVSLKIKVTKTLQPCSDLI